MKSNERNGPCGLRVAEKGLSSYFLHLYSIPIELGHQLNRRCTLRMWEEVEESHERMNERDPFVIH